jgi:phospholipase/lecithinase/hemolysin
LKALAAILLLTTAPLLAQAPAPTAKAAPFTMLYVFGDSYSDSGSGYADTNGLTAVAYMAEDLHIPFTYYGDPNSKGKGLNFAISGAGSGAGNGRRYPTGQMLGIGMKNQVDNFVAFTKTNDIPKIDPDNTLFFFAGGLNDRGKPDGYTRTNIEDQIETLYGLGGRRFVVALLPTKIRQFASAGTMFNPELTKIPADELAKHPDIRIANSNWGFFLDEVMVNPAKYGITNTTKECAGRDIHHEDTTPCADPDAHFFYHEGHPSMAVHKAAGAMLAQEKTPVELTHHLL